MEAEKLLEECEDKIHKPLLKNKGKFLRRGVKGEFKAIRGIIFGENKELKLKEGEVEAFIGICNNRIDRLKSSTTEIVTSLGAIIAVLAVFLIAEPENKIILWILSIILILVVAILALATFYYRAQSYAWYAVKEGVLLVKKEKNEK